MQLFNDLLHEVVPPRIVFFPFAILVELEAFSFTHKKHENNYKTVTLLLKALIFMLLFDL